MGDVENQKQADCHRNTHAQQPYPGFAHPGMGMVNNITYYNVGYSVEQLGCREQRGKNSGINERNIHHIDRNERPKYAGEHSPPAGSHTKTDSLSPTQFQVGIIMFCRQLKHCESPFPY